MSTIFTEAIIFIIKIAHIPSMIALIRASTVPWSKKRVRTHRWWNPALELLALADPVLTDFVRGTWTWNLDLLFNPFYLVWIEPKGTMLNTVVKSFSSLKTGFLAVFS